MFGRKLLDQIEVSVIGIFITIYAIAASLVSLNRYWQFNAFWYDFGVLDETVWKLSRFQMPIIRSFNPPLGLNNWSDHFNPSVILLAPLYWLTDKQEIMFLAQVAAVCLSAVVFYLIARKVVTNALVRVALVVSYLGFVGMQNALFTDTHTIVYALLPLSLVFWAIYNRHWKMYWLFLAITLGFQESLAAVGAGVGLYLFLRRERFVRIGIITVGLSLLYAALATKLIVPFFAHHAYNYLPQYPHSPAEWITNFFLPADLKLKTIVLSLATFGFLPALSLPTLPLIIEHFFERFVLNTAATRWDLGFHYNAPLAAFMLVGNLEVIAWLQKKKIAKALLPFWATGTILIVIFLHRFYLHGPLLLATNPVYYQDTSGAKFLQDLFDHIPQKGLIMAPNNIDAHLTHRDMVLLYKNYQHVNPDWIVLDTRTGQNANNFYPLNPGELDFLAASVSADPNYKIIYQSGNEIIYGKK